MFTTGFKKEAAKASGLGAKMKDVGAEALKQAKKHAPGVGKKALNVGAQAAGAAAGAGTLAAGGYMGYRAAKAVLPKEKK